MELLIFVVLLALGYGFGRMAELRHYRSILQREEATRALVVVASKYPPQSPGMETQLVCGNVVISVDYFKRFLSALRNLVGGRVKAYETLVDRARREAILRMKEEAADMGADRVFNLKLETSSIYKGRKNAIGSVEVLAYGTAIRSRAQESSPGLQ